MGTLRVLVIGDIVGEPGRRVCCELINEMRQKERLDFVIANGENVAGGSGVTQKTADSLYRSGVNVITTGDHVFKQKDVLQVFNTCSYVLRPANFPPQCPGIGSYMYRVNDTVSIGVINILGRVFASTVDCPFRKVDEILDQMQRKVKVILVDFHAEATSEKIAMGWYLDGRVSGVLGTHTHVQTADETILPNGTAYITDLGMTGPFTSVLGRDVRAAVDRFLTQMPVRLKVAQDDLRMNGVILEIDADTGKALSITRVQKKWF